MSGLWLLPLGLLFYNSPWAESFLYLLLFAAPIIGGLHSFLPLIATFSSPGFAERMRLNKSRIIKVSLAVVLVSFALSVLGGVLSRPELWLVLGYAYLVWNTWHFAAQNFGVLSLYRSTHEQNTPLERKLDKYYCITMGCVIMPILWFCIEARWGPFVRMMPEGLPIKAISTATLAFACGITLAYIGFELRKKNRSFQKIAYVLSISAQALVAVWAYYPFHFLAYSIPHWMVEIGITGTIQTKEAQSSLRWRFLLNMGLLIAASAVLIYFLEMPIVEDGYVLTWFEQLSKGDIPINDFYTQFTIPALISFLIVPRSFFHFYISRQVFKSTRWTLGMLRPASKIEVYQNEKSA
jgi:hypothetical protein